MFLLERPDHCTVEPKRRPLRQNYHSGARWKEGSKTADVRRGLKGQFQTATRSRHANKLAHSSGGIFLSFFFFLSALCCKSLTGLYHIEIHKKADKQLFGVALVRALEEPLLRKSLTGVTYRVPFS